MLLINKRTGETLKAVIENLAASDYQRIEHSKQYTFSWSEETGNDVYKIYLKGENDEILGLMSLTDYPDEYRIHLNLIEVEKKNQGRKKKIDNIVGCLIAFACQIAFDKDYLGFVSLQPKTKLIDLYQGRYGFRQYGRLLAVEQQSSMALIDKYLEDEQE